MPRPITLPAGLTARPLSLADAPAVAAVIIAEELHDLGVAGLDVDDVVGDWQRPSFVPEQRTLGVFDGARLVGFAELTNGTFTTAGVHPEQRGRGIGTALAGWIRHTAHDLGLLAIGTHVAADTPADRLLARLGYAAEWTAWDLELRDRDAIRAAQTPAGVTIRPAVATDHPAAHAVVEDAFLEWSDRERRSLEDWAARSYARPGFAAWQLPVAIDEPTGDVLAVASLALRSDGTLSIDELATRTSARGQGLASALLAHAVATSANHGATRWVIATDTRSGARTLYERVGFAVQTTWVHRTHATGPADPRDSSTH